MPNRHPKALWVLFLTETCERYGFYTIQSIISLYLALHLGLSDVTAYEIAGAFTALTYISPIMGGWIADNYIGQRKAIIFGAIILCSGYLGLAFNSALQGIIFALATVAMGTGLLKPNISSILGHQYAEDDPRRNTGFTLFYMGINLGILLGTTIPTQIQFLYGWQLTFISAAFALLTAIFIFAVGSNRLKITDYSIVKEHTKPTQDYLISAIMVSVFFVLAAVVLTHTDLADYFFIALSIFCAVYVLWTAFKEEGTQRLNTFAFFFLCIISVIFWAAYFQIFLVLTLFISRCVQPTLFGIDLSPPHYVALQSIGIMVFGYILQKVWVRWPDKHVAYGVSVKFAISILLMFIAYALIVFAIGDVNSATRISPWPVLIAYLFISLAELMLSPIALSAVTMLIRPQIVSTMMGVFFVTLGVGAYLSGELAKVAAIDQSITDLSVIKTIYHAAFIQYVSILGVALVLSLLVVYMVRSMFLSHQNRYSV